MSKTYFLTFNVDGFLTFTEINLSICMYFLEKGHNVSNIL